MKIVYYIKQGIKIALQQVLLPRIYGLYCHKPIKENTVIFADGHNNHLPFSMQVMYDTMLDEGYDVKTYCLDYQRASLVKRIAMMCGFMKAYARAEAVFICDYFLPAAACKKRPETQLIQMWHACGAFKKFGYDAKDDIAGIRRSNPMKNCTMVTVSSEFCRSIYARAFQIPVDRIKATGVSRTDLYFDQNYIEQCKRQFYQMYPLAKDRKILLWAPTFRGHAGNPKTEGIEIVEQLQQRLGDDWYVIIKLHPHQEKKTHKSNCTISTEELLPVADVLMTDYSSVLFDFMIMKKPVVLFTPDNKDYLKRRGFYLDYQKIPAIHVRDVFELPYAIQSALSAAPYSDAFYEQYMGCCDGHATERILKEIKD